MCISEQSPPHVCKLFTDQFESQFTLLKFNKYNFLGVEWMHVVGNNIEPTNL